jgi:hypothetical protein
VPSFIDTGSSLIDSTNVRAIRKAAVGEPTLANLLLARATARKREDGF